MGISNKCFEILESKRSGDGFDGRPESRLGINGPSEEDDVGAASDGEDDDADNEDVDGGEVAEDDAGEAANAAQETESEDEDDEDDDSDDDSEDEGAGTGGARGAAGLRLREILFYDDKVAIFKARHGRL